MAKVPLKLDQIIDGADLRAELAGYAEKSSGSELRTSVMKALKARIAEGRKAAETMLMNDGGGTACAARLSHLMDVIITEVQHFAATHIYPTQNPSSAERLAIVAVGGYGRGTLAPGSDIDLLFLLPYKQTPWGEQIVEYVLYMLWDMG